MGSGLNQESQGARSPDLSNPGSRHIAVLHGSNDLYGASRVLMQDVEVLRSLGHRVTVVLPADGPLTQALRSLGAAVAIERLTVIRRVDGIRALRVPLRLPLAARNADVVVLWTLALAGYAGALAVRRRPSVVSVHEILESRLGRLLARLAASRRVPLMANSEATAAWLERSGCERSRIAIAYPAAPAIDRLPEPASGGTTRAVIAGRVNGHKGHLEAVAAVAQARDAGADVELTLVGGSYRGQERHLDAVKREVERHDWATYAGEVHDVRPLLREAHVVLVPTTRPEPFGVVALEAWAAGRRVIGSEVGGLAEAVRMVDGLLVPPADVPALAEALLAVAADPALLAAPRLDAAAATACTLDARRQAWTKTLGSPTRRAASLAAPGA